MRVLVTTYGSRGDVQPMIALTVALRNLGVEVAMCVPPDAEFVKLLERYEIQLIPAFASVRDWVDRARQSGMRLPQLAGVMIPAQYQALSAAAEGCDAIVATGLLPSVAAAKRPPRFEVSISLVCISARGICHRRNCRPWSFPDGRTHQA